MIWKEAVPRATDQPVLSRLNLTVARVVSIDV